METIRRRTDTLAVIGGGIWLGLWGVAPERLLENLFLLGPLVVVPLGIGRLAEGLDPATRRWLTDATWVLPPAAMALLGSFALPPGLLAAAAALPWGVLAALVAMGVLDHARRRGSPGVADLCRIAAGLDLAVGAGWLLLSRAGAGPLGYVEPIVLLTAVHFHFAGFAAAVIAAEATARLGTRPGDGPVRGAAIAVAVGTPAVAAGFVIGPGAKVAAILVLSAGVIGLAAGILRGALRIPAGPARSIVRAAAMAGIVGMVLAVVYGVGEYTGAYWLTIPDMALLHGPINGLGFAVGGLLGFRLAAARVPEAVESRAGSVTGSTAGSAGGR